MGVVIEFFQFLWKILSGLLEFLISLPGMIANTIIGVGVSIYSVVNDIFGCLNTVYTVLNTCRHAVDNFLEMISETYFWGFLYHLLSLDVAGQLFSSFITLALVFVTLTVFDFFFAAVCTAVPFLMYKAVGKIVQAVSIGYVKPT